MAPEDALLAIQEIMDGVEWNSDTAPAIAEILTEAGYKVRDLDDQTIEELVVEYPGNPAAKVLIDKVGINEEELYKALGVDQTNPFQDRSEIQHKDHERIWLEPAPGDAEGRTWCEDKVWPEKEGEPEPTEYVRADILNTVASTLAITGLREAKLKAVLQSLVNDIRSMRAKDENGSIENVENWYVGFSEWTNNPDDDIIAIEWPNLAISCEEAEKLLQEI